MFIYYNYITNTHSPKSQRFESKYVYAVTFYAWNIPFSCVNVHVITVHLAVSIIANE